MTMGRSKDVQEDLFVAREDLTGPGHPFYEALDGLLREKGFDDFVEAKCKAFYVDGGRRSIPPGTYFRMLFIGYFEGIESERQIAWRCADSFTFRQFLGLRLTDRAPDHSSLSVIRHRLTPGVFDEIFRFVLQLLDRSGLVKGRVIGVDSTTIQASASMRSIERKADGVGYRDYVRDLATKESGSEASPADATRHDKKRKKRVSNAEWESKVDPDAKITRMKDGTTRLGYKPEHAVDLDTNAILGVTVNAGDQADSSTISETLDEVDFNLESCDRRIEGATVVGDKGYHSDAVLRECEERGLATCISEPKNARRRNWRRGDDGPERRRRCYANRRRKAGPRGKTLLKHRGEKVERSFAHAKHRSQWRRTNQLSQENVWKRYLIQAAGVNLGVLMRSIFGAGTPKALAATAGAALGAALAVADDNSLAAIAVIGVGLAIVTFLLSKSVDWLRRSMTT